MKLTSQQVKSLFILSLLNSIHGSAENSLLAGSQLSAGNDKGNTTFAVGFAVSKTNPDGSVINQGVLTSSFVFANSCNAVAEVGDAVYNGTENNPLQVGQIDSLLWGNSTGLCYTYITVSSPETVSPYVLRANSQGIIEQIPVTSIATPNQINTTVCGYGSANGYFCGRITGFNETSWNICNPLAEFDLINLEGLTVVNAENHSISLGDNGGPIYIENESNGIITAQAVGIITLIDQGNNDTTLLYTPINNLLAAQGFNLMIANVSTTSTTSTSSTSLPLPTFIPPVSGENYVELWLDNYLANGLPVCDINNNTQLVKRVQQRKFIRAGEEIVITNDNQAIIGICTVGFGIRYQLEVDGIITAGHCSGNVGNKVYLKKEGEEIDPANEIGSVAEINYGLLSNNDYAIIRLFSPVDNLQYYFLFSPRIQVLIRNNPEVGKILGAFTDTRLNQEVCGYGVGSRRILCGEIVQFDHEVTDSHGITLRGLVKVSIGNQDNFQVGDDGAPIYVTLGQYSQGVGAVGHLVGANDANPQDKFFYYEPISVIPHALITGASVPVTNLANKVVYGGRKIYIFSPEGISRTPWDKQCTIAFAVKNIVNPDKREKSTPREGFITAAHCIPGSNFRFPVFASRDEKDKFGSVAKNEFEGQSRTNSPTTEDDYASVMLNIQSQKGINLFTAQPWVKVVINNQAGATAFYQVVGAAAPSETFTEVKAYGAVSGYRSGVIVELNVRPKTIPNSRKPRTTIIVRGLVKVMIRADQDGFVNIMENNNIGDDGGPVYLQNDLSQTVQAVGLIVYSEFDNDLGRNVFYYLPIQRALTVLGSNEFGPLVLMTRDNQNQNIQPRNLVSENLAAQIEVPVK